jgi:hypothetical protein
MKWNLKVILSAVGVAALLATPAMAKSHTRHYHTAPAKGYVPNDAYGSAGSSRDNWMEHTPGWDVRAKTFRDALVG